MATQPTEKTQQKSAPELTVNQVKQSKGEKLFADIVEFINSPLMKSLGYNVESNKADVIRISRNVYHNTVAVLQKFAPTFHEGYIKEKLIQKFPEFKAFFNGDKWRDE